MFLGKRSGLGMLISFWHLCSVALSICLFLIITKGSLFFKLGQCESGFPYKEICGSFAPFVNFIRCSELSFCITGMWNFMKINLNPSLLFFLLLPISCFSVVLPLSGSSPRSCPFHIWSVGGAVQQHIRLLVSYIF